MNLFSQRCDLFGWGRLVAYCIGGVFGACLEAETVVSIADREGRPGTSVLFPIVIEADESLYGVQFDVRYDADQLIGVLATADPSLDADTSVRSSFIAPGVQRIAIYSLGVSPLTSQTVAQLEFSIPFDVALDPAVIGVENVKAASGNGAILDGLGRNGTLSIKIVPDVVSISGQVQYFSNEEPMSQVSIRVEGAENVSSLSDDGGGFFVSVPSESALRMVAEKVDDVPPNRGVTTLDLLLTRRHILGLAPFGDPYQMLAADVDRQGDVGAIDILLMRRLILGLASDYVEGEPLFRLFPKNRLEENESNPWEVSEAFEFSSLAADLGDPNFTGVKLGDVDGDWTPSDGPTVGSSPQARQRLTLGRFEAGAGPPVWLHFRDLPPSDRSPYHSVAVAVPAHVGFEAIQFSLQWNPDEINVEGIRPGDLAGVTREDFAFHSLDRAEEGLSFAWTDPVPYRQYDGAELVLFYVDFVETTRSISKLALVSEPTPAMAFVAGGRRELRSDDGDGRRVAGSVSIPLEIFTDGGRLMVRSLVASERNAAYVLEFATQLPALEWSPIAAQVGTGDGLRFEDKSDQRAQRYYRVRKTNDLADTR